MKNLFNTIAGSVKDYGKAVKCGTKVAYHLAKGSSEETVRKAAEPFEEVAYDPQRLKNVQKVGAAVSVALWTSVICAIID